MNPFNSTLKPTCWDRCLISLAKGKRIRLYSTTRPCPNDSKHIDKWFQSIVKPVEFYELHAEGDVRRYFYNIDLQGRLFLEETLPKNIATSIKDDKFLNFFFSRIRWTRTRDLEYLISKGIENHYPFVSLCGKEVNFIRPAATPIVFHSLVGNELFFGGNLKQSFESSRLAISSVTGRLYHEIPGNGNTTHKESKGLATLGYGLIRSSVAVALSEHIHPTDNQDGSVHFEFLTETEQHQIPWLPLDNEPGLWAFPGDED